MTISDTSALVLNWTSRKIYETKNALNYFENLDLSDADDLFKKFDKEENVMQSHLLSNRKYFVRKCAIEFLERCKRGNFNGHIIILAAGIDPLSVEIASLYPGSYVFDVDKYSMKEKEEYVNNICPNIKFIECDITDITSLEEALIKEGWNTNFRTLLIMEGITYYLHENDLRKILTFFAKYVAEFACDFGINPEFVNEQKRSFGIEVRKKIIETVGLEFMNCYDPDYYITLVKQCGFKKLERVPMKIIQLERTGEITPFEVEELAWTALARS